jgi:hypothetical protein
MTPIKIDGKYLEVDVVVTLTRQIIRPKTT